MVKLRRHRRSSAPVSALQDFVEIVHVTPASRLKLGAIRRGSPGGVKLPPAAVEFGQVMAPPSGLAAPGGYNCRGSVQWDDQAWMLEEQRMMRQSCRDFVDDVVIPFIRGNWQREWDMTPGGAAAAGNSRRRPEDRHPHAWRA